VSFCFGGESEDGNKDWQSDMTSCDLEEEPDGQSPDSKRTDGRILGISPGNDAHVDEEMVLKKKVNEEMKK